MDLIHLLQQLAGMVSPDAAMAAVLLTAAAAAVVCGWRRSRPELRHQAAAIAYLALAAIVMLAFSLGLRSAVVIVIATGTALLLLGAHVLRVSTEAESPEPAAAAGSFRVELVYLAAATGLTVLFLFADLSGFTGWTLVWEPGITQGFEKALRIGQSVVDFTRQRLLWDEGLVSSGQNSLLYGAGTYLLWRIVGVSLLTLRLTAAVLALLCLPAAWLAGRECADRCSAAGALAAIAVSPVLVFYGRYGTSLSGTLLAVLLAIAACCRLSRRRSLRWWHGPVAGAALYLATVGYSTARPVAVALMAVVLLLAAIGWRRLDWNRVLALLLVAAIAATVWMVQRRHDTSQFFVSARGEQILQVFKYPGGIRVFLGRDVQPRQLSWSDRIELAGNMLEITLPEFAVTWGLPFSSRVSPASVLQADPPKLPLYPGALLPFALWGFAFSLRRFRQPQHLLLLAAMAAAVVPPLFTTRVDSHRLMIAAVPLVLWIGLGLREAIRVAEHCRVPAALQHAVAVSLLVLAAAGNSTFLYHETPSEWPLATAVLDEIGNTDGRIEVVARLDDRELALIEIALIGRWQRDASQSYGIASLKIARELGDEIGPTPRALGIVERAGAHGTVILCPSDRFVRAAFTVQQRGLRVTGSGPIGARFWVLSTADAKASRGEPVSERLEPPQPRAAPLSLPVRRGAPLHALDATAYTELISGFAEPWIDQVWDGGPLAVGGAIYPRGIGMHAWTRMRYAVPQGATELVAIIGLADTVRDCERALVSFEVWGDGGEVLYDSGPFDRSRRAEAIEVPVAGHQTITLVATEGGNGRDCDYACWAMPSFVIARLRAGE